MSRMSKLHSWISGLSGLAAVAFTMIRSISLLISGDASDGRLVKIASGAVRLHRYDLLGRNGSDGEGYRPPFRRGLRPWNKCPTCPSIAPPTACSAKGIALNRRWSAPAAGGDVMRRAMPKSMRKARPSRATMMFDGLTSRCAMPRLCAYPCVEHRAGNGDYLRLRHDLQRRIGPRELSPDDHPQRVAFDQRHDKVSVLVVVPGGDKRYDVRVRKGGNVGQRPAALDPGRELYGHGRLQILVETGKDDARGAPAQLPHDRDAADRPADVVGGSLHMRLIPQLIKHV